MKGNKKCRGCAFSFMLPGQHEIYQCRKNPPGLFVVMAQNRLSPQEAQPLALPDMFPTVKSESWCGEWRQSE